jgi:hypothetical protein
MAAAEEADISAVLGGDISSLSASLSRSLSSEQLCSYDDVIESSSETLCATPNDVLLKLSDIIALTILKCQHAEAVQKHEHLEALLHNICSLLPEKLVNIFGHQCRYFDVLAVFFASDSGSDSAGRIQHLCLAVWTHDLFPPIYALLFHRRVICQFDNSPTEAAHLNILIRGCCRLFWWDAQDQSYVFQSLFSFLCSLIVPESYSTNQLVLLGTIKGRNRRDLIVLVYRFLFHYCCGGGSRKEEFNAFKFLSPIQLLKLLVSVPLVDSGKDFFQDKDNGFEDNENDLLPSDVLPRTFSEAVVDEWCAVLSVLSSESGRCKYLVSLRETVPFMTLSTRCINRVKTPLHALMAPGGSLCCVMTSIFCFPSLSPRENLILPRLGGCVLAGPFFPTRQVRHEAKDTMDALSPVSAFSLCNVLNVGGKVSLLALFLLLSKGAVCAQRFVSSSDYYTHTIGHRRSFTGPVERYQKFSKSIQQLFMPRCDAVHLL